MHTRENPGYAYVRQIKRVYKLDGLSGAGLAAAPLDDRPRYSPPSRVMNCGLTVD